ncbi:phage regulatory CII family protein [Acinetobacter sp. MD2(2019)]|uniref:phage regulatory CII family protein n=1 Tax=Acinetobacter sp. MD2(2019) TaxID=2605273 RepID=UPI002D1F6721|nr:phage regulatory CII family protein [Acinetobacter sp. MD2(2019)]MEB3753810.1 XRE family transcriptional regulator [Acinetobacter sp. MD2(2019)]
MEISKETKTALHKMIHQSLGITPKDVADVIGVSHKTILNYANPNMDEHLPSLKAFEAVLTYTQNPAVLKVWAHKLGLMLVPVKQATEKEHQVSVLESLLHLNIGNGQMNKHVHDILEDGVVTPSELDETLLLIESIEQELACFRKAVQGEAAKYLSAIQTEKA